MIPKANRKPPYFLKPLIRLAVTIPISSKNMDKNPLKISVVNGSIPLACVASAISPIIKLPISIRTLPPVRECFIRDPIDLVSPDFLSASYSIIKITPTMMAGDSIIAIIATI